MTATLRDFAPSDYEAMVEVSTRCWPEYGGTVKEARRNDEIWDHAKYFKKRLVAERAGKVVAIGALNHSRWAFVPEKMWLGIDVDPDHRRAGIGSALYDALVTIARGQGVTALKTQAKESLPEGVRFVEKRGFAEIKRDWESRLDVTAFDEAKFAAAPRRVAEQGVRVVTLADEVARLGRDEALRLAYELDIDVTRDVPMTDAFTPQPYETWLKDQIEAPSTLFDAWFMAVDPDGRYVAISNLFRELSDPSFLWQGITGVRREARGRGLAMALKLRTVEYARAHGVREIKTWNDQRNRPMLRINEAMGFVKQPAWIEYEKVFAP